MDHISCTKEWKYGNNTAQEILSQFAEKNDLNVTDEKFCQWLDKNDPMSHFRNEFKVPKLTSSNVDGELQECIYLCGNSLGLQPKTTPEIVNKVLKNWEDNTISCHVSGALPAAFCDQYVQESMSKLVGAYKDEVVAMNGLSVNLHLFLVSFYQPTETRHKVLLEEKAFPSDFYAIQSQIKQRGYDPKKSMLFAKRREGEHTWRPDDILKLIETEGDSIALVMLPGVHYYTGQAFDMKAITKAAHEKGCMVGFDLAHAVGNLELYLHEWNVDFACWCSYKYMCSGPGAIAGAFLHRKHKHNEFPKFLGWWGHREDSRFDMTNVWDPAPGIESYRVSNPPPLLVATLRASLDIFDKTNMREMREKSFLLTGYLEMLIKHYFAKGVSTRYIEVASPADFHQRGCQLSLIFRCSIEEVHEEMKKNGIVCDTRKPNVMRIAPHPMYNTFNDVYRFIEIVKKVLAAMSED